MALAKGQADPVRPRPLHRQILGLFLDRLELIESQIEKLRFYCCPAFLQFTHSLNRQISLYALV